MKIGTVSPSTFVWIIPSFPKHFERPGNYVVSPDFHQPDSSWYLELHCNDDEGMDICVCRGDSGPFEFFTYTINIKSRTDVVEITDGKIFEYKDDYMIAPVNLKKEIRNSNLLITCYIKCDSPQLLPGWNFVTSAVQTEVEDSVTEKENPKVEDSSSVDMKDDALLRERMKDMLLKGSDHDLTICVQDKEFRAHRNILSTRSPVFAMMLSHDTKENNTGTINIEDCDPESFDEFLLYVYCGRTENLTPSNVLQLYYPADKYDFPVLKERCVSLLKTSLSVESICDVVLLAAKHQEKELLDMATEFFARNMKKIVVTVAWQKFMPQNPVEANELIIKGLEILHPKTEYCTWNKESVYHCFQLENRFNSLLVNVHV